MTVTLSKIMNMFALVLLLCSICSAIKVKTDKSVSKGLFDWNPKWQFRFEAGKIKLFDDEAKCSKECKYCYATTKWEDTTKVISKTKKFICVEEKTALVVKENEKIETKEKRTNISEWTQRDLCDAFCQPSKKERCFRSKKCLVFDKDTKKCTDSTKIFKC